MSTKATLANVNCNDEEDDDGDEEACEEDGQAGGEAGAVREAPGAGVPLGATVGAPRGADERARVAVAPSPARDPALGRGDVGVSNAEPRPSLADYLARAYLGGQRGVLREISQAFGLELSENPEEAPSIRDIVEYVERPEWKGGACCAERVRFEEFTEAQERADVAESDAAALREVLEDCHIHNEYVRVTALHADRLKRLKYYGRPHDKSAAEHETAVGMALSGAAGRALLVEVRGLRATPCSETPIPEVERLRRTFLESEHGSPYTRALQAILENAVDSTPRLAEAIDALRAEERARGTDTHTAQPSCSHPAHKVVGYQILLDESYVRWCTVCGSFRSDEEWVAPEKGGSDGQ